MKQVNILTAIDERRASSCPFISMHLVNEKLQGLLKMELTNYVRLFPL